jgi:hypothetical protein
MIALDTVQSLVRMWARISASQGGMITLTLFRLSWMFHQNKDPAIVPDLV